jgi:outer membrane protein assembly factor BamB
MLDASNPAHRRRMVIFALIAGLSCIFLCTTLSILAFKQQQKNYPDEPVATGDFPPTAVWMISADTQVVTSPIILGYRLFVRTKESVYALDVQDGTVIWRTASPGVSPLSVEPLITDNIVFVPEKDSRISAFDIETGDLLWRSAEIDFKLGSPALSEIESIAVDDRCVYVARYDWNLICYSLDTGEEIWNVRVPNRSSLFLAAGQDMVFLGADHYVRAYYKDDGQLLWENEYDNLVGPILFDNGTLYVTFDNSSLIALNSESGQMIWSQQLDPASERLINAIASIDGRLYVGSNKLYSVSEGDGTIIWESSDLGYLETPVKLEDRIYVRNIYTTLHALDIISSQETGQLHIQFNTTQKHEPHRSPLAVDDLLIVPFGDNRIFAYRP